MQWNSWSEFWAMGGYGFYVWGSFAVTFVCIAAEILTLRARDRATHDAAGDDHMRTHP